MENADIIIGIDPGINGAIAVLDLKAEKVSVFDVPTIKVPGKGRGKKSVSDYDKAGMADLLSKYQNRQVAVSMEKVHAMPGQGVTSMFTFGRGVGIWEGMLAAFGWEIDLVTPQNWKKEYGDRLLTHIEKPELLKTMKTADYNKASLSKRKKYDDTKKEFAKTKKQAKDGAKDEARSLALELFPSMKDELKLKKHSDRAEALLIAERKRRTLNAKA